MSIPLFPELTPKVADPLWFSIDKPRNDEAELLQLEQNHQSWFNNIGQREGDFIPIGKTATECQDDDEDEEEEDDNDDEESETHDEEDEDVDMELSYEVSDSPVDGSIRMQSGPR